MHHLGMGIAHKDNEKLRIKNEGKRIIVVSDGG